MSLAGFKPTIPASERPRAHASDRAANGTGLCYKLKASSSPASIILQTLFWTQVLCTDCGNFGRNLLVSCCFISSSSRNSKSDHYLRHVCLSVRPNGTTQIPLDGFRWNLIPDYTFNKSVERVQITFKSDKNNRYVTWILIHYLTYLAHFFFRMWNISEKSCRQNHSRHFMFSGKLCILWYNVKNTVEPDRPQITIWRMCIAWWTHKATNRHSEYVVFIAFPLQHSFYHRQRQCALQGEKEGEPVQITAPWGSEGGRCPSMFQKFCHSYYCK
jgi:hypothetical protein